MPILVGTPYVNSVLDENSGFIRTKENAADGVINAKRLRTNMILIVIDVIDRSFLYPEISLLINNGNTDEITSLFANLWVVYGEKSEWQLGGSLGAFRLAARGRSRVTYNKFQSKEMLPGTAAKYRWLVIWASFATFDGKSSEISKQGNSVRSNHVIRRSYPVIRSDVSLLPELFDNSEFSLQSDSLTSGPPPRSATDLEW